MGILARSLPGNLTIWREILTFEIKKYIRNSGKSDYLAGKNTLFQAVAVCLYALYLNVGNKIRVSRVDRKLKMEVTYSCDFFAVLDSLHCKQKVS